ncbi:hypothetical protein P7K49_024235, partial [Saguinus oedipus]
GWGASPPWYSESDTALHSMTPAAHNQGKDHLAKNHPELQPRATAQASSHSQTDAFSGQTRTETWTNMERASKKELPVPQRES